MLDSRQVQGGGYLPTLLRSFLLAPEPPLDFWRPPKATALRKAALYGHNGMVSGGGIPARATGTDFHANYICRLHRLPVSSRAAHA